MATSITRMNAKHFIVTGANSGIGYATALELARKGGVVGVVCRNAEKARVTADRLKTESGNPQVHAFAADLASQRQIRETSREILARFSRVDALVNNAGTWYSKHTLTEDGIETVFAVNHLACFLLAHRLMPALRSSADARIVNVGSDSHRHARMHFEDLNLTKGYHGLRSYAQSKLANLLFTFEFARRCPYRHILISCPEPGLVKTGIGNKHTTALQSLAWRLRVLFWDSRTPAEGAETPVFLASAPEVKGQTGLYWHKNKPKRAAERAYNREDWRRLWEISSDLCDINDYFQTG